MDKRLTIKPAPSSAITALLQKELGIDVVLASVLARLNINDFQSAKNFFRPSLTQLLDPFQMKDMDKAIARIQQALKHQERILIYGDYDVDGTTAVALVYTFFQKIHHPIDYYIPDRYKEGYGISKQGIDWAHSNGYSLIIALDCGIKANDKVDYATSLGIDFIICDHHRPGSELPAAIAVLDPKRNDCNYPFKELSGCCIGYKLIQAYCQQTGLPESQIEEYLDLVAVSIASDLVSVVGENRILAHFGLKRLNENPRPGFKALKDLAKVKTDLSFSDLGYKIGPRINAAGRLESGRSAVELLITANSTSAQLSGQSIDGTNTLRRDLDTHITEEALAMIRDNPDYSNRRSTVIYNKNWHKGVVGIVASRLMDTYYRPTIVLTEGNGLATGSARSVKDFDVYEAIEACGDLLEQFGGHKYAAGLTLKVDNIPAFSQKFESIVSSTISDSSLIPEIEIDACIPLKAITSKFVKILKQMEPFGTDNPAPIFYTENVTDTGQVCIMGSNHLRMNLIDASRSDKPIQAIAFGMANHFEAIYNKRSFSICYYIEENNWNDTSTIQLRIKDIQFNSSY